MNIYATLVNECERIIPDKNNDWINKRDEKFNEFPSVFEDEKGIFLNKALGVNTSRDQWVYSFNKDLLAENVNRMIENYNSEVERLEDIGDSKQKVELINNDESFIKWSRGLKNKLSKSQKIKFDKKNIVLSMYRPFVKKWLYYDKDMNENPGQYKNLNMENELVLYITGVGAKREFSAFVTNLVPNLDLMEKGQGFPFRYDLNNVNGLLPSNGNLNENLVEQYGFNNDEELFYYVYAILNNKEYKEKYKNDLAKSLPKIPILKNKKEFILAGKKLVNLHLDYENVPEYSANIQSKGDLCKRINKIRIKGSDIVVNSNITIKEVPQEVFEYVINGKTTIGWVADQYQEKKFPNSKINQNPNEYLQEDYVFKLILKLITVSIETMKIINSMPSIEE